MATPTLEASQQALAQLHALLVASESDACVRRPCKHSLQSSVDTPGAVARAELPAPQRSDACRNAALKTGAGRSLHASAVAAVAATKAAVARAPSPDDALVERRLRMPAHHAYYYREGGKLQSAIF